MKANKNSCSVYVTFVKGIEVKTVELCSLEAATEYITDVIIKNDWKFMSMTRGTEYKEQITLTEEQQKVYNVIRKDAEFYMEQGQFTITASHFGGLPFKVVLSVLHELETLGLITLFPDRSCYFDGQINNF